MAGKKTRSEMEAGRRSYRELRRAQVERQKGYRAQALRLFPWICARCGRTFSGKHLSQLTVHHMDHNHDKNPPDGSNWELLCVYCHENEHSRAAVADSYEGASVEGQPAPVSTHRPFSKLKQLLKKPKP